MVTQKDGTTYKQDKYEDNPMHVSDGGGTYTFDGCPMIKWQTTKNKRLKVHPRLCAKKNIYGCKK